MKRTPNKFEAKSLSTNVQNEEAVNSKRFRNDVMVEQPGTSLSACVGSFNHLTTGNSSMIDHYAKVSFF